MRAPRWFERFRGWRWAPFFALVAGALVFVALALLLIPMQVAVPEHVATAHSPSALVAPVDRTLSAALPARALADARELPNARHAIPTPSVSNVAPPVPSAVEGASPSAVGQPDFSANIADRGDRPVAPARGFAVH